METTITKPAEANVVPYEPGIPLSSTVRAALTRFLPGATLSVVLGVSFAMDGLPGLTLETFLLVAGSGGIMTLGYLAGLEVLRRRLYPDARVEGSRSFVAGLVAPLAAFATGVLGGLVLGSNVLGFLLLPSVVIAVVMFFAWLTPTPDEMRTS